jgi:hypothetical protein
MIPETTSTNAGVRLGAVLAILTARFTSPALILVTAATKEDNTTLLATSLAASLETSGKRCAYVPLATSQLSLDDKTSCPYVVLRPSDGTLSSQVAFDNATVAWRDQYHFIFFEAPSLLATTLVPHIARTADGVLIAMRRGRAASGQDRDTAAMLKHLGAFTIGVVTTPGRATSAGRRAASGANRPLPTISDSRLHPQPVES